MNDLDEVEFEVSVRFFDSRGSFMDTLGSEEQEHLSRLLHFAARFQWIYDFQLTRFLCDRVWENVPPEVKQLVRQSQHCHAISAERAAASIASDEIKKYESQGFLTLCGTNIKGAETNWL